jgi:Lrp/AsnC family transcriptional regulator, leucine-responsive regulatory protein
MSREFIEIDNTDKKIIELLQKNAALTSNEIAKEVGLSPSAVHERIRKLHASGVIRKISAFIQAAVIEKSLCAFIYVLIDTPSHSRHFLKEIIKQENVMECHHVTGEYSYLLKVRVKDTHELERFITEFLKSQAGVTGTLTQVVLSSPKDGDTIID